MLTLEEVKTIAFRRANFRGYKPKDVDNFIDEVENSYEKLLSERENFIARIEKLTKKVKIYEEESKSIKQVIKNAQITAEDALNKASDKAQSTLNNAKIESKKILDEANKEAKNQKSITEELKLKAAEFKQELVNIYNDHLKNIETMPTSIGFSKKKRDLNSKSNTYSPLPDDVFIGKLAHLPQTEINALKFGKNYTPESQVSKNTGVYGGCLNDFKKF